MALAGQRGSVGRVWEHHGKPLRHPLTERPHQEVSAELVDTAAAVEADDAVAAGQQEEDRACLLTPQEEHPLGPVGDRHIADDRSGRCGLAQRGPGKRGREKREQDHRPSGANPMLPPPCAGRARTHITTACEKINY